MFDSEYWYKKTDKKFLHNIDSFYFSVKLVQDFTANSESDTVNICRSVLQSFSEKPVDADDILFNLVKFDKPLIYHKRTFAGMYNFCLECPDSFDFFMAPTVPANSSGECVTSEIHVQIRSRLLWEIGPKLAYDYAFSFVQGFCDHFHLQIKEVHENRLDFCYHTNYFKHPEKVFSAEAIAEDSMGYLGRNREGAKNIQNITEARSDGTYHVKYTALGNRGEKCFLRIYLKTQEVIEQSYKSWFFYHWLFNGMISRYDLYCLEAAYKQKSFSYVHVARCKFIQEYLLDTLNDMQRFNLDKLLNADSYDYSALDKFASKIVPEVTKVYNIEFQVMRKMSKSFVLLPLNRDKDYGIHTRIYDVLDNRRLITDYLTYEQFRMIKHDNEVKSRCSLTDFWNRLRNTKMIDAPSCHDLKLIRKYSNEIDVDIRKQRAIRAVSSFALMITQNAKSNIFEDAAELLACLNDNDIHSLYHYKEKNIKRLDKDIKIELRRHRSLSLFDTDTGEIL